ncbi:uncharacterized protein ACA1_067450 [Acanthamoeba castellanii str. Neff]|uniref:Uncharacterized protein n=1 Tax=Acanthamoeba castellanii (strain ATCC 30010 / Neff) TaxID=1257118 RepID=L8GR78_ACACF|nr:uncharacterized protein ACA1_067450 [Acanthamoeba castellanii str. Neff]ELR15500.1 hypothetical protein ACA1_067450 [Acanthamoeba castellanii str. Neff]
MQRNEGTKSVVHHHHHHHHGRRRRRPRRHFAPPGVAPVAPTTPTGPYIRIVEAKYGVGKHWEDVTDQLQQLVLSQGGLQLHAFGQFRSMNALFGNPGNGPERKRLEFSYEVEGEEQYTAVAEDRKLHLAMGSQYQLLQQREGIFDAAVPQEAGHFNIVFFECSYGKDKHSDVTTQLQDLSAKKGGKSIDAFGYWFTPNGCMNKAFGDPDPGQDKELAVNYYWQTPVMSCSASEDQQVSLSYEAFRGLLESQ